MPKLKKGQKLKWVVELSVKVQWEVSKPEKYHGLMFGALDALAGMEADEMRSGYTFSSHFDDGFTHMVLTKK